MNQNDEENIISNQNDTDGAGEETEAEFTLTEEDETDEDSVEFWKKKAQTAEAQKIHWKEKATKPTEVKKPVESAKTEETNKDLSTKDLYALMKANIEEDDIDEVVEYARFKKIPISEAIKSTAVKSILNDKAEERRSAQATSSGMQRRSPSTVSNSAVLDRALNKGELPDTDAGLIQLYKARKGIK